MRPSEPGPERDRATAGDGGPTRDARAGAGFERARAAPYETRGATSTHEP